MEENPKMDQIPKMKQHPKMNVQNYKYGRTTKNYFSQKNSPIFFSEIFFKKNQSYLTIVEQVK